MQNVEDKVNLAESILDQVKSYIKTSLLLNKYRAVNKTADIGSKVIPSAIVLIVLSFFMFFINLAIAIWLGDLMGHLYYGFFVVAGFYLILALVLHFFVREPLKKKVSDLIVKNLIN